jgi:hypothetical protein
VVTPSRYAQISVTIRGNLIAKIIFRHPLPHKLEFATHSLLKLLYLGIQNASKKWTMPIHDWNLTLSRLAIFFESRFDGALDL